MADAGPVAQCNPAFGVKRTASATPPLLGSHRKGA